MARALVVVDVQNDFCEGGAMGVAGGVAVAKKIAEYIESAADDYDVIVATRDAHIDPGSHFSETPDFVDSWPPHCVVGTPGQDIRDEISNVPFDAIFDKGAYEAAYSGFEGKLSAGSAPADHAPSLASWLREKDVVAVDLVGIATDYCVAATARDAVVEGFQTRMLVELTAPVDPNNLSAVSEELAGLGVTLA